MIHDLTFFFQRYPSPTYWRTSCDEFPFAIAAQGGTGAHIRCASDFEQDRQGNANGLIGGYAAEVVNGDTSLWNQLGSAYVDKSYQMSTSY